jgi:hypothetical protein
LKFQSNTKSAQPVDRLSFRGGGAEDYRHPSLKFITLLLKPVDMKEIRLK